MTLCRSWLTLLVHILYMLSKVLTTYYTGTSCRILYKHVCVGTQFSSQNLNLDVPFLSHPLLSLRQTDGAAASDTVGKTPPICTTPP
jgi:hypothetical protein